MKKLQEYLKQPLPDFQRGSADCCAFVANWAEFLSMQPPVEFPTLTDMEAQKKLLRKPLASRALEYFGERGWKAKKEAADGDIIIFPCPNVFGGKALGIFQGGKGVTRMEAQKIFVHHAVEPELILGL